MRALARLLTAIAIASCNALLNIEPPDPSSIVCEDSSCNSRAVSGRVRLPATSTDRSGLSVGGMVVSAGSHTTHSDNRGFFTVADVPLEAETVRVTNRGFSHAVGALRSMATARESIDLVVQPTATKPLADAALGGALADGFLQVVVPGNVLTTPGGLTVVGPVACEWALAGNETVATPFFPGGSSPDGVFSEVFAALDLRFYQGDAELQLQGGLTIAIPLTANSFAGGEQAVLWWLNEDTARWETRATAVIVPGGQHGLATGRIDRLGWWAIAQPVTETGCIRGQVLSPADEPTSHVHLAATGEGAATRVGTSTDADGWFCLDMGLAGKHWVSAFVDWDGGYAEVKDMLVSKLAFGRCNLPSTCSALGTVGATPVFSKCKTVDIAEESKRVLIFPSDYPKTDAALVERLLQAGFEAVLGPGLSQWDGSASLSDFGVVYLQRQLKNPVAEEMPAAGQRQLTEWVNCGGRLLTSEFIAGAREFAYLRAIMPVVAKGTRGNRGTTVTYEAATEDPLMVQNLPPMFSFSGQAKDDKDLAVESDFNVRPGATEFFRSTGRGAAAAGWNLHRGRVLSISAASGEKPWGSPEYQQLLENGVRWLWSR